MKLGMVHSLVSSTAAHTQNRVWRCNTWRALIMRFTLTWPRAVLRPARVDSRQAAAGTTIAPAGSQHGAVGIPDQRSPRADESRHQIDVLADLKWPKPADPPVRVGANAEVRPVYGAPCPWFSARVRYRRSLAPLGHRRMLPPSTDTVPTSACISSRECRTWSTSQVAGTNKSASAVASHTRASGTGAAAVKPAAREAPTFFKDTRRRPPT